MFRLLSVFVCSLSAQGCSSGVYCDIVVNIVTGKQYLPSVTPQRMKTMNIVILGQRTCAHSIARALLLSSTNKQKRMFVLSLLY